MRTAIVEGARRVDSLTGKVSSGGVADAAGALAALRGNPYAGNGNGGGDGHGNGNGQGNGNGRPYVPAALRHDNDHGRAKGKDGEKATPPEPRTGAPLGGLPDLAESRKRRSSPPAPAPPARIQADMACADCNPSGGSASAYFASDPYVGTARARPANEVGDPGENIGSLNFNWGLPLVNLSGRAGLDLSVSLYYNSLVWTRQEAETQSYIVYNADHGTPAPGFQLGLPRLQAQYQNGDIYAATSSTAAASSYMMITPSGGRVEMRQVGTSGVYESADSTYTQLTFPGGTPVVRSTDGMQYVFGTQIGAEWRCTQVKDRNGNYISAGYNTTNGHVLTMMDTLGRVVYFNYNGSSGLLESITQNWGGTTHNYASFYYTDKQLALNFDVVVPLGVTSGSYQTVLDTVVVANGESYHFDYNAYGQVYQIKHSTPNGQELERKRYDLTDAEIAARTPYLNDCPRFSERRDWARYWNGDTDGVYAAAEEAVTGYYFTYVNNITNPVTGEVFGGSFSQMTTPDGMQYREYSKGYGFDKGLPQLTEEWPLEQTQSGPQNVKRKWVGYAWTQDNTSLTFTQNPRLAQTNVYDTDGNERQTTFEYNSGYALPTTVREWGKVGGQMVLQRRTVTDYQLGGDYLNSRVIGLPWQEQVYDGTGALISKRQYLYDWDGWHLEDIPGVTIPQHDPAYSTSYTTGRGNRVAVLRYDVNDPDNLNGTKVEFKSRYNKTGSLIGTMDAGFHQINVSYADNFSDSNNSRNTYAYPTTVTDADNQSSTMQYNYDFGVVTRTHTPSSGTGSGVTYTDVATSYYADGRPQQATVTPGGTYQRWEYDDNLGYAHTYETITGTTQADEFHSWRLFDGAGRVRATASDHPGSTGGFSGAYVVYDKLGQAVAHSNPTEIDAYWNPVGDDVLNTSQNTGGWRVTTQTYDWKGRPLQTTNTDGTTRVLDYGGCGCAGGEVTTSQDEHGRQSRYTKDVLGRLAKVEELNWNGTAYSTTQYSYNARDQIETINQAGQLRTFDYDGHGRLWHKTTPEQGQTTYTYYADDTVNVVTDARGATATYSYTSRHQISGIDYNAPPGSGAAQTTDVGYLYDAAGNRFWMTDGEGTTYTHYDSLGRLDWEERNFNNVGSYRLDYEYNPAGEPKKITYPWQVGGMQVTYGYDKAGRLNSVGGTGYSSGLPYASSITYRAFGGVKGMNYGDGRSLATSYDRRLRPTKWDVAGVLGYKYYYYDFSEHTGRVTFAQDITGQNPALDRTQTASSLDRSYEYDNVGRLAISHAGNEARAHAWTGQWTTPDGNYSQGYDYDVWGNVTHRYGWGGEVLGNSADLYYTYATGANGVVNNRRAGNFTYDNAGNLTFDGGQHFTYDAQGNQVEVDWMSISQGYDGDGRRVRRSAQNTSPARYLRSSVLGGQVVAEIDYVNNTSWQLARGYVYTGSAPLAMQQGSSIYFIHEDPITKGKRVTDTSGAPQPQSALEFDPFGAEAGGSNTAFQPRKFTSYERDPNGTDEAMFRRYNRWHARFDQPDPYEGSYDQTDPQSFNRYAYAQNDSVNHVDPTGLMCYNVVRTDVYTDNGQIAGGPWVVGQFGDCGARWGGFTGGGLGGQDPTGPWVDPKGLDPAPPNHTGCDLKLAKIFGGPGAVASTGYDPPTLGDQHRAGRQRAEGHSAAPYHPNPDYKGDSGGIIHVYTNAAGADITVGLYMPPGGVYVGGGEYAEGEWGWSNEFKFKYTSGPLKGLQIQFNHVGGTHGGHAGGALLGRFPGDVNDAGSVRIGNLAGIGGDSEGYRHSHLQFEKGGKRVDPRTIFCKEFGY